MKPSNETLAAPVVTPGVPRIGDPAPDFEAETTHGHGLPVGHHAFQGEVCT